MSRYPKDEVEVSMNISNCSEGIADRLEEVWRLVDGGT